MRRHLLLLLVIALVALLPVRAQDSCEINLLDDISQLVKAQDAANNGDTTTATQAITDVQAHLADLLKTCAPSNSALPTTFEFPDGLFRFNYPAGWAKLSPVTGVYVLGNDQAAVNSIVRSNIGENIPAGAQIVIAAYGDVKSLFNASDFAAFVEQLQKSGMAASAQFVSPENVTLNDLPGVKLTVSSDLFDGTAYVLDLGTANKIVMFIALTPRGEYEDFEATFESIVASMQIGQREVTGTPTPVVPVPIVAQPGTPLSEITYKEAVKIGDLVDDVDQRTAMLSPDGTRVAWFDSRKPGSICVYTLAEKSGTCQDLPEIFHSTALVILWSPDSRYIAFTQDAFIRFDEPDIWVYNTETQIYTNRTEDNVNRVVLSGKANPGDSTGPMWYDHTFTWGPDNNIYFVRFNAPETAKLSQGTNELYRIAPESGDAELIRELPFDRFSIYQGREYELNGVMAVSPDATQIALIVNSVGSDSPDNGVWIMPLSGDEAPTQVVHTADLILGTTQAFRDNDSFLLPMDVAWTPDQTGLYLYASNPQVQPDASTILYHVQIDSGVMTPLVDFSAYTPDELLKADDSNGHVPLDMLPRAAVMSPDGTTPVMLNTANVTQRAWLTALTLSADGVEQTPLLEFDYVPQLGQVSSVSSDGKILMAGLLFLPEE